MAETQCELNPRPQTPLERDFYALRASVFDATNAPHSCSIKELCESLNRLASQLSASQASGERWRKALAELVACKELADKIDDRIEGHQDNVEQLRAEYARRKPAAWKEARKALEQA